MINEQFFRLNPFWVMFDNQINRAFDQSVYYWLELYYLPFRIIGNNS